jgi:hypothetical protein
MFRGYVNVFIEAWGRVAVLKLDISAFFV